MINISWAISSLWCPRQTKSNCTMAQKRFVLDSYEYIKCTHIFTPYYNFPNQYQTRFDDGDLLLTSHRLFWGRKQDILAGRPAICLPLRFVLSLDEETTSSLFGGIKTKLVLQLCSVPPGQKRPGPSDQSMATHVKLSAVGGLQRPFIACLRDVVAARVWEADQLGQIAAHVNNPAQQQSARMLRTGIVGIERKIHEKQKETNETISVAFQDLSKLMVLAKDMVTVSQAISAKMVQRQGEIFDDETIRLKAHLLGLGIDNPVLRDSVRDENTFHELLSNEIDTMLLVPLLEAGGMMPLAEAYCRVNRARGLELLSPDDVMNACRLFRGAVRLRTFAATGTMVLQLDTHDDMVVAQEILAMVTTAEWSSGISIEELARVQRISVVLAHARLLAAEQLAILCRDESIEGIRFYENRFLTE